jgi:hypothetical protein
MLPRLASQALCIGRGLGPEQLDADNGQLILDPVFPALVPGLPIGFIARTG